MKNIITQFPTILKRANLVSIAFLHNLLSSWSKQISMHLVSFWCTDQLICRAYPNYPTIFKSCALSWCSWSDSESSKTPTSFMLYSIPWGIPFRNCSNHAYFNPGIDFNASPLTRSFWNRPYFRDAPSLSILASLVGLDTVFLSWRWQSSTHHSRNSCGCCRP